MMKRHYRQAERHYRQAERHYRQAESHYRQAERHYRQAERHYRQAERHYRQAEPTTDFHYIFSNQQIPNIQKKKSRSALSTGNSFACRVQLFTAGALLYFPGANVSRIKQ